MHIPETKIEGGGGGCFATNQVHENQCIGLIGEFCQTILCLPLVPSVE
jgi:hypothetical protein